MRRSPALCCAVLVCASALAATPVGAQSRRRSVPARQPTGPTAAAPIASETAPGPATEPATEPASEPAPAKSDAPPELDVDALRREYLSLADRLFRSRARAAAVASSVYSSRLRVQLDYDSARFYTVTRATVRLDGANIFDDARGAIAADRAPRWNGFVAPGRHVITVRIEATGKDDRRFATALESSFTVQAPAGKDLLVKCAAKDDGDIPYQWQRSEQGSYRLRLDVAIESVKRAEGRGGVKRSRR
jgi:hypothetical protein